MILVISILVYLISVYGMIIQTRLRYSPYGRWSRSSPHISDLFVTIIPIINTLVVIALIIQGPLNNKENTYYIQRMLNRIYKPND